MPTNNGQKQHEHHSDSHCLSLRRFYCLIPNYGCFLLFLLILPPKKNLLLFLTSAIQEVTSACSSLMFTKIFLFILDFNTDLLSVACCAFVCSDYSLLDLHLITVLYYFPFWWLDEKNNYFLMRLGLHLVSSRPIQTYSRGVCKRGSSSVIYA